MLIISLKPLYLKKYLTYYLKVDRRVVYCSTMKTKILLAPLSGVSDFSFRLISREFGAGFCFFEMLDANAILKNHRGTMRILKTDESDLPIGAQIVGGDSKAVSEAASKLFSIVPNVSLIDLNCGCPVKKVIKKGAGSALLKDHSRLSAILKGLKGSVTVPITVKLRVGYDKRDTKEAVKTAKVCENNGASIIFVHGRTREDGYSGEVDYEAIREIKNNVKIPVYGSGNIFNPTMAAKMFNETNCDGILVARGALGNPWIFKDIENYLATKKENPEPNIKTKKAVLKKHLSYIRKYKDLSPSHQVAYMRKIAIWYMRGLANASQVRKNICEVREYNKLIKVIDSAGR